MKQIELTQGQVALLDDEDFARLARYKWCYANGYAIRREGVRPGYVLWLHKEVLMTNETVDHVNNNTLDNRRVNLRLASKAQNSMNRPRQSNNTSGYKGVARCRDKWQAYIKKDGKKINLGTFLFKSDAAKAYNKAAQELFGEFAQLNQVQGEI